MFFPVSPLLTTFHSMLYLVQTDWFIKAVPIELVHCMPGWSHILYIFTAYYMQKGGKGVQIACKISYVLNGRPFYEKVFFF